MEVESHDEKVHEEKFKSMEHSEQHYFKRHVPAYVVTLSALEHFGSFASLTYSFSAATTTMVRNEHYS